MPVFRLSLIMGPEIFELEQTLASYVGVKHCITVASGTASLEIVLRALGVGPGDEVVTVPFTWISSAEVIGLVGASPVFVDSEAATYNINVAYIEAAITPRTKAILPVSLFGQMPDYDRINEIAARHKLAVIEDGAQSFGATQSGRRSCGATLIGSTSFFPAKPLGCYGAGGPVRRTRFQHPFQTVRARGIAPLQTFARRLRVLPPRNPRALPLADRRQHYQGHQQHDQGDQRNGLRLPRRSTLFPANPGHLSRNWLRQFFGKSDE